MKIKKTIKKKIAIKKKPEVKKIIPKKNVSQTVAEKLNEIKSATQSAPVEIPKGNLIEQAMIQAETAAASPTPLIGAVEEPEEKKERKPGSGRPKGSRNKSTKQAQEEAEPGGKKIDQIMIYEEVALMALCAKFKRDFKDVQLTSEEKDLLLTLQPETEFLNRPSWPNYIVTNLALIMIKWFNAPKKTEPQPEKIFEAVPSETISRQNSPEENTEINRSIIQFEQPINEDGK